MSQPANPPSPQLFFETINAYERTAALKAAVELNVFGAIGEGHQTAPALAKACAASERGMRMLCDYLTIIGLIAKQGDRYSLTVDSEVFLDRRSPAYMGGILEFILSPTIVDSFKDLAAAVRKGGTIMSPEGTMAPEHPVWIKFARAMVPMMGMTAEITAKLLALPSDRPSKVLDISASHGMYGIALARNNPNVTLVAQDWANVLQVAQENADKAGLGARFSTAPGSAFEVEFGEGYDVVLMPNFLHHFDQDTCVKLLQKVHRALVPGGQAVAVEFVPNEDRVSPPPAAAFAIIMLATTAQGDAYTYLELDRMFRRAGFSSTSNHGLEPSAQRAVIARK